MMPTSLAIDGLCPAICSGMPTKQTHDDQHTPVMYAITR